MGFLEEDYDFLADERSFFSRTGFSWYASWHMYDAFREAATVLRSFLLTDGFSGLLAYKFWKLKILS